MKIVGFRLSPAPLARAVAVVLGLLLVAWLVIAQSRSAFTATTANTGNSISTGQIRLTDNDAGSALFTVTGLTPGVPLERCLEVTYTGTIAAGEAVRLYGGYADGDTDGVVESDLAPYLDLAVATGTAGSTCAAFTSAGSFTERLDQFGARSGYDTGRPTGWSPQAGEEMRPFRVTLTLKDDNAAQGRSAEPVLTWEVRS